MALPNDQYTVGWICALQTEAVAAYQFLDGEPHGRPIGVQKHDNNHYTLGQMGGHNVVIALLPAGVYGTSSATRVARDMLHAFPNIRIGLMVGIGGGAPSAQNDIRLGDIVVSTPKGRSGGVFQYDYGKTIQDGKFQHTGHLNKTPDVLLAAVAGLGARFESDSGGNRIAEAIDKVLERNKRLRKKYGQPDPANDRLYKPNVLHSAPPRSGDLFESCTTLCGDDPQHLVPRPERTEREDDPMIFQGIIASANSLMKDALIRDTLSRENAVLCFEMEAAGLMDNFPCLVVRGICDYSDTHKNDAWHGYAAMSAAAYAKALLLEITPARVKAEQRLVDSIQNIEKSLVAVENTTFAIQSIVRDIATDQEQARLRDWLGSCDPSTNYISARNQRFPGSGNWFVQEDPRFTEWMTQPHSFLWLYGLPGCGKTVLSSTIIEFLGNSRLCLYFYFTFQEQKYLSLDSMLRVLIWQLCSKHEASRRVLNQLHPGCKEGFRGNFRQPSTKELSTAFSKMLNIGQEVWIVIDALDECTTRKDSYNTEGLISWVKEIAMSGVGKVHLLVTSREEEDIRSGLGGLSGTGMFIPIEGEGLNRDIEAYVQAKITQSGELKRWRKIPEIQKQIQAKLLEKAGGMFRYVACQIRDLEDCIDRDSLYNALENLPRDLDETYSRIMARIPPGYKSKTIRVLQLLTYGGKPLRVEELVDAVAVHLEKSTPFDPMDRMPEPSEVARYCSSLTKFVTRNGPRDGGQVMELHLAHFSVKEYLVSSPETCQDFSEMVARASIAMVCMSYLRHVDYEAIERLQQQESPADTYHHSPKTKLSFHDRKAAERRNRIDQIVRMANIYPFLRYSASSWLAHAAATEKQNGNVLDMTADFLAHPGEKYYQTWELHVNAFFGERNSPFVYACRSRLSKCCLERLIKYSGDNGLIDGIESSDNPLQAAIKARNLEHMRLLMDNGATVRARYFYAPCAVGYEDEVKLLLQYSKLKGPWGADALTKACERGHLGIVNLLIEHDARLVNIKSRSINGDSTSPLIAACDAGKEEVALLLLQRGATMEMNSPNEGCKTVLGVAVRRGLEKVVEVMVKDHSAVPEWHELKMAVEGGLEGLVQILWNSGNLDGKDLDSALLVATELGLDSMVLLLLQLGADVNCRRIHEGQEKSALEIARESEHDNVVAVLLGEGAGTNVNGREKDSDEASKDPMEFDGSGGSDEDPKPGKDEESEKDQESHGDQDQGQECGCLQKSGTVSSNPGLDAQGSKEHCSKPGDGSTRSGSGSARWDGQDKVSAKGFKDQGLRHEIYDQPDFSNECGNPTGEEATNDAAAKAEQGIQSGERRNAELQPKKHGNEDKQDTRQRNRSFGRVFTWLRTKRSKRPAT